MGNKEAGDLKQYVKEIKNRMVAGAYAEIKRVNNIKSADKIVVLANKCLSQEEICDCYDKVVLIHSNEECIPGAVGRLINEESFAVLTPEQRERYVLVVAGLYKALSDEFRRSEAGM